MNKRLKELLTPKLKEWGGDSGDNFSEELEKFAGLIIKECANIAREKQQFHGYDIAESIKDHFGVE